MADIQTKVVEETQEIIVVSEDATVTNTTSAITATIITDANDEPTPTPEVTEPAPIAPAPVAVVPATTVITEAKQESRLSLAFKKISGGCGKLNQTFFFSLLVIRCIARGDVFPFVCMRSCFRYRIGGTTDEMGAQRKKCVRQQREDDNHTMQTLLCLPSATHSADPKG